MGTIGYEQADVSMVAGKAGVSEERFTELCGDKKACFIAIYEELRQEYIAMNGTVFLGGEDWRDGMRRTAYAAFDYFQADQARAKFVAIEALNAGEDAAALLDETLEALAELVHMGRFQIADPDSVPRSAATNAVGSIWSLLVAQIRSGSFGEEEEVVPQMMFFAIMPYLGAEAAREELGLPRPTEESGA